MPITGMILGCLLLGQTPDAVFREPVNPERRPPAVLEPAIRATSGVSEVQPPAPTKPASNRLRPPEMVADAIRLPNGSALTGQPLTLISVLGSTMDRRQQLDAARAYWRLVHAVAEYHYCFDHVQELGRIKSPGDESALLRLARASAAAMLRQAESEAMAAQCELARLTRLPAGAPLPLPVDRPHVGAYRTNFQELFGGRTPPEPAALVERILPIRRQAVDDQAAAVQAAEDVLAAMADAAQGDMTKTIASSQELLRQRKAFIRSVCDYNRNIADYGLAVASPAANPQTLAAILIGPAQQGVTPVIAGDVQPTGANVPIDNTVRQPTPAASNNGWRMSGPTSAPPVSAVQKNEPTLAPARDTVQPVINKEATFAPASDRLQPVGKNEPTLAPPREEPNKIPARVEPKPLVPVETAPSTPSLRTANKPAVGSDAQVASALYPALQDAAPGVRAKQLTVALHWDRSLPERIGKPMSLAECLARDPGADRRATIEAYWRVRQRAAEYQVLVQQGELLEGLVAMALQRRNEPSGAAEMLRLREAQLSTQASLREAHVALVEAQYALAMRLGATGESAWPLASTVPHSGSYLLRLDAQPRAVVESWPVRRLATTIPALADSVQQNATAVVEADAARVAATEKYRRGDATIDQAIEGIIVQTRQTMAVLGVLTEYNRAIADYVMTIMPSATPANRLVAALVTKP